MLPWLDAAGRQGHEVLVAVPPALADMVGAAGHRFQVCGEPPEADVAAIREQLPVVAAAEASRLGNRELFGRLGTAAMLPGMEQAAAEWRPDLILRDPCEYASAVVAYREGIPSAQVAISLAEAEAGSLRVAEPALRPYGEGLAAALLAAPYLSQFPAALDPSPFKTTRRYRPPWLGAMAGRTRLPDWWGDRAGPLVYLTFGTVIGYLQDALDRFRTALEAVSALDARVLLTVGRKLDPARLGAIPANVHVEAWVPQQTVVGQAALVVCHGGSGTVLGALAAGVPVVAVPVFGDQFSNGQRVAAAGAGLTVEVARPAGKAGARRQPRPPQLTRAILEVLGDPRYRQAAEGIAAGMAGEATVDEILGGLLVAASG
jgi:UDP:flavonoid glycosyltransferase YjiC (YdhE family)